MGSRVLLFFLAPYFQLPTSYRRSFSFPFPPAGIAVNNFRRRLVQTIEAEVLPALLRVFVQRSRCFLAVRALQFIIHNSQFRIRVVMRSSHLAVRGQGFSVRLLSTGGFQTRPYFSRLPVFGTHTMNPMRAQPRADQIIYAGRLVLCFSSHGSSVRRGYGNRPQRAGGSRPLRWSLRSCADAGALPNTSERLGWGGSVRCHSAARIRFVPPMRS